MRRFTGNELFERYSEKIRKDPPFVFNRLYLNNVTLTDFYQAGGKDNLVISFKRTSQRVDISSGTLRRIDAVAYATNEVMVLSRDSGAGKPKGSLYAHSCPSCGGPLGDTMDLKCGYCGADLNSTKNEWIITELLGYGEYQAMVQAKQYQMTTNAGAGDLDPLYKVRDYAFNNIMMILVADGQVTTGEQEHMNQLARKLGYDTKKLAGLFELARNRQLVIRLPEEKSAAEKVYKAMHKAAMADGTIAPEEQAILDDVQSHISRMAG
jgi:tellurite resistance protein